MSSKVNWVFLVERKMGLLFQDLLFWGTSRKYFSEETRVDYEYKYNKYVDGRVYASAEEMGYISQLLAKDSEREPRYLQEFADRCYARGSALVEVATKIGAQGSLQEKEGEDLQRLWEEYKEAVLHVMPYIVTAIAAEMMFERKLKSEIGRLLGLDEDELQTFLHRLVLPPIDSAYAEEFLDIWRIGYKIQREENVFAAFRDLTPEDLVRSLPEMNVEIWESVLEHARTFGWMTMYGYVGEPMQPRDVVGRLKKAVQQDCSRLLARRRARREKEREEFEKTLRKYHISPALRKDIEIAQRYLYLRMFRWDVLAMGHYFIDNFRAETARRMGIRKSLFSFLKSSEIEDFLYRGKKPNVDEAEDRERGYAMIVENRNVTILTGDKLQEAIKELPKPTFTGKEIPGAAASLGLYRGAAKIVKSIEDVEKVNEGDIVVSPMTTPDLALALEKAGAIVTDEGGLLSHAAIVSRELGIPCVVGTRFATRVLHDGDIIEVDANKKRGVVYIIERAQATFET